MTIKELYDDVVSQIAILDKEIEYTKGKREALNGIRLDLFNMIDEQESYGEICVQCNKCGRFGNIEEDKDGTKEN